MSDLNKMQEELANNEELQRKFEDAAASAMAAGAKNDTEVVMNAAKELGYTLTEEEIEKSFAEAQELSESDLAMVSGGANAGEDEYGHNVWCWTAWHCYNVTLHTETDFKWAKCFSNYDCFFLAKDGTPPKGTVMNDYHG